MPPELIVSAIPLFNVLANVIADEELIINVPEPVIVEGNELELPEVLAT